MGSKKIKALSVIASAALVVGAFAAGPAEAKKKKKKPAGCAAYTPSQWSTDIPVTILKDEHTADAPLEIAVPTEAGVGTSSAGSPDGGDGDAAHAFVNVQVDSAQPVTGVYGTVEFTPVWDYDLFVRSTDGVGLAYSAGFSPFVPAFGLDGTGHGGHSGVGTENVEGLTTDDCTGYLVDVVTATGPGEEVTLTLWLGEATYVPE